MDLDVISRETYSHLVSFLLREDPGWLSTLLRGRRVFVLTFDAAAGRWMGHERSTRLIQVMGDPYKLRILSDSCTKTLKAALRDEDLAFLAACRMGVEPPTPPAPVEFIL